MHCKGNGQMVPTENQDAFLWAHPSRILLETDALYLRFSKYAVYIFKESTVHVGMVAEKIGPIHGLPWTELLKFIQSDSA